MFDERLRPFVRGQQRPDLGVDAGIAGLLGEEAGAVARGQVDDALLVELSWRTFRGAAIDYGDYCRFRASAHPGGDAGDRVLAWENDCLAQAALLLQRRQIRASRYAHGGDFPERFRVC
jgi:hypothetical protein